MGRAHPKAHAFYADQERWHDELAALRAILNDSGLCEEFKWRSPVYTHDGHNVALVWGFKDHAALGFFKGVLLADKAGILVAQGENSRSTRVVKVTSVEAFAGTVTSSGSLRWQRKPPEPAGYATRSCATRKPPPRR